MNYSFIEGLKTEQFAREAIESIDTQALAKAPRAAGGSFDAFKLNRDFGSGGGLMSQFDTAVRLSATRSRLDEIRVELAKLGVES